MEVTECTQDSNRESSGEFVAINSSILAGLKHHREALHASLLNFRPPKLYYLPPPLIQGLHLCGACETAGAQHLLQVFQILFLNSCFYDRKIFTDSVCPACMGTGQTESVITEGRSRNWNTWSRWCTPVTRKLHSDEVAASETTSHTPDIAEDDRYKVLYLLYVCDISERTQ